MLHEKEAFESNINALEAFLLQHTQNCHCFDETELEKKIHEVETLNASLDANFLTLQNGLMLQEAKQHELINIYGKLSDAKNNLTLALNRLKASNDLIKFLKININITWVDKTRTALLNNTTLSTREKIILWCGVLERAEKDSTENLVLRKILYKEQVLVKTRFLKPAERNQSYENTLDTLQHLFSVRECSGGNRSAP